jgi:hypothetical protein
VAERWVTRWRRFRAGLLLGVILLLATIAAVSLTQAAKPRVAVDPLVNLRVGHWVTLDGVQEAGRPVSCTSLHRLAGDLLDEDWSLKGLVQAVDAGRQEFSIAGCRIRVNPQTIYGHQKKSFSRFADIRAGMLIEAEGSFLHDRVLLASEIDDDSHEALREPKLRDHLELLGKIERIDVRKRLIVVMGVQFSITEKTRVRSAID